MSKINFFIYIICGMLMLVLIFLSLFFSVFCPKNTLYAQENPKVDFKSSNEIEYYDENELLFFEYSNAPDEFELKLKIANYNFSVGDKVTYYYIKLGTDLGYKTIKSASDPKITVSQEDLNYGTAGDISFNPYPLNGIGKYRVLALINDNQNGNIIQTDYFVFEMKPPILANVKLNINYYEIENPDSEFNTYYLFSEITINGEKINSDNFVIFWFMGQNELPFSNQSAFEWNPTKPGNYTISARIEGGTSNLSTISIVVDYDRNAEVLAAVVGIAALMLIFVILSTYIKVKSERVW